MKPERWQQIEQLYHAALERAPEERAAFLDAACNGDRSVREEVEALLAYDEPAQRFITRLPDELVAELLAQEQTPSLVGGSLGHYQVLSLLGKGGMGEVYLAADTRLGRKVAVKLLPEEFTRDAERVQRFEQEARTASALNHPNIITIHEIGQVDQHHFIVSEFVEGETLRQRMKSGLRQPEAALEIAVQVASALATAHAAGIVHRDIKPENVMLRPDGLVKVLDFGLAKLTETPVPAVDSQAPTVAKLSTETGVVMGTVQYMSPEQARGQKVDQRTDIFSLGVMLYEMLAGRRPFEGTTTSDVIAALLTAEPPPLRQHCAAATAELERIVGRCLMKEREARYQLAAELSAELKKLQPGAQAAVLTETQQAGLAGSRPAWRRGLILAVIATALIVALASIFYWRRAGVVEAVQIKSLAVLPFKSLNREAKEEYLGLGLATDIITKISQSGELMVRPTSAVRKYVTEEMDAIAAARELKVDAVLDSQFQHVGDRLRVNVNLLRVADGATLWAEKFDERFTDIFAIQDKVSQQVAQRLRLRLSPAGQTRLTKRYTSDAEAYNYYAKAMYHFGNIIHLINPRPESDLAVDLFKKSIELDPKYALAHAQLGYAYANIAVYQEGSPTLIAQAKQELGMAERLDPQLAEVHVARSFILWSQYEGWQADAAIRELRLAQQLDANVGHSELAALYNHLGLDELRTKEIDSALNVDPNNDRIKEQYVNGYLYLARPDEALEVRMKLFNRGPDLWYYLEKRMVNEAEPLVEQEYQQNPGAAGGRKNRALLLALQGKHREAEAAVPEILEKAPRNRGYHHLSYDIARIYALGGKTEKALEWLRETVKEGFPCYPLFARDTFLDRIRKDPAFVQFLAEMKTRWESYQREFG